MNNFEKLMAEYDNEILFKFNEKLPIRLPALIVDKTVYVNPTIQFDEAITYLAEEIGHHNTLAVGTDITDQSKLFNRKLEKIGREWGYKKLVPKDKIIDFISKRESTTRHDLAEEFELPVDYIDEVINMYKIKGEL